MRQVSRSHVLAAKALASLHICTGSPEPRHSHESSNGDLCTIYVNSEGCVELVPETTASVRCINAPKCSQCVVIKFLVQTYASLPRKNIEL